MNELVVPSEEHGRSFYAPAPKPVEEKAEEDAWSSRERLEFGVNLEMILLKFVGFPTIFWMERNFSNGQIANI